MANLSYKKSTVTTLKACGFIDTNRGTIDIDGEEKKLLSLLSDFDGSAVELVIKIKDDEELDAPASE